MSTHHSTITITETEKWDQLVQRLRQVTLAGDPTLRPYQDVTIESRVIMAEEVWPVSRYVLEGNIETQRYLHSVFEHDYSIDTLHLDDDQARIMFQLEGESEEWSLIPPIIEESPLDGKPLLVDGEHRFMLAKELGVPIRVLWIKNVPLQFPIVATPIEWSEVIAYPEVPDASKKRDYRYPTLESFPDISAFSQAQITKENYLYFFYRDLTSVCTSGVRRAGTK